jgi:hypothetical protein
MLNKGNAPKHIKKSINILRKLNFYQLPIFMFKLIVFFKLLMLKNQLTTVTL